MKYTNGKKADPSSFPFIPTEGMMRSAYIMAKKFNMKSKGNFDFGNKGIYDIKTETKDQSVVEADKPQKKSIFKNYKKGYYKK